MITETQTGLVPRRGCLLEYAYRHEDGLISHVMVQFILLAVVFADLARALLHRCYHRITTWPDEYGVFTLESVPRGFVAQHAMPFRRKAAYDDYVR